MKDSSSTPSRLPIHEGAVRDFDLVLVVDDEPYAREIIGLALEMAGFRVKLAANGVEGLALVLSERPRVVLTDIHMPQMDGDQLASEIQAQCGADAPVVIGFSADRAVVQALRGRATFHEVLTKPVAPRDLIEIVMRHLSNGSSGGESDGGLS